MANYRTYRNRTLTATGAITGKCNYSFETTFIGGIEFYSVSSFARPDPCSAAFNGGLWTLDFTSVGENLATLPMPPSRNHRVTATITVTGLFGTSQTWTEDIDLPIDDGSGAVTLDGSYTFSVYCDEILTEEFGGNDDGYANYGGTAVPDMPRYRSIRIWEKPRAGQTAEATVTFGFGGPYTITETIPSSATAIGYALSNSCTLSCSGLVGHVGATSYRVISTVGGETLSCPFVKNYGSGNATASVSAGSGLTVSISGGMHHVTGGATIAPPKRLEMAGALYTYDSAYPATVRLRIDEARTNMAALYDAGGTFTKSIEQKYYSAGASYDDANSATLQAYEWDAVRVWVDRQWLVDTQEDTDNWRVLMHGKAYDALTLQQTTPHEIDTCASLTPVGNYAGTWANVSNCTVTAPGVGIKAVVSGGDGTVRRTFTPNRAGMGGYRYLAIRVRTEDRDRVYGVRIGAKTWATDYRGGTLRASPAPEGGAVEYVLDLCNPSSLTADTDTLDTRWPMPTSDDGHWGWGVQCPLSLEIYDLEDGGTYYVEAINLKRLGANSYASCLPAFKWSATESDESGRRRFLFGDTDGRSSMEETDTIIAAMDGVHSERTIADIKADIEAVDTTYGVRNPGWRVQMASAINVSDGAEYSDWENGYLNKNRPATWLYGGGLLYTSDGWEDGLDVDCASAKTMKAQMLFDRIEWYPGIGDLFGLAVTEATTKPLYIGAGKIFRGRANGIVVNGTTGASKASARVAMTEVSSQRAAGEGVSNSYGQYETGAPYGRSPILHRVQLLSGSTSPYADLLVYARKQHRVCLRASETAADYLAIESDSPRAWMYVSDTLEVGTWHAYPWTLESEAGGYTGDVITRLRVDTRRGLLLVLTRQGGEPNTFRVYTSYDGGQSGTLRLTVIAWTAQIQVDSVRGLILLLWDDGASVYRQVSQDAGVTWSAASAVSGLTVGELGDITIDTRRGVLYLAVLREESGQYWGYLYRSHDTGETWEELTL